MEHCPYNTVVKTVYDAKFGKNRLQETGEYGPHVWVQRGMVTDYAVYFCQYCRKVVKDEIT